MIAGEVIHRGELVTVEGGRLWKTRPRRNLHLVLTGFWYAQILSGRKRIEYRQNTSYWHKRLCSSRGFTHIVFHRGYTKQTQTFRHLYTELNTVSNYFEIHFTEVKQDGL